MNPSRASIVAATLSDRFSIQSVEQQLAENSLHHFVRQAWRNVEPKPFVDGWHLQAICEHLEAVTRGEIKNLIINIPPRHTKSLTVSVMWPAWVWASKPEVRWMFCSYGAALSTRDSVKCRRVIQSAWYQKRWGGVYRLTGDQNAKTRYDTNKGGYRLASSVDGMATGEGGDALVVDDPINIKDAHSETVRQRVKDWWDGSMSTRRDDPKMGCRVIIMQRCHHDDLTGHVLETMASDYELLMLPAEYDPGRAQVTSIGFSDPRKRPGDLLWPERFGAQEIAKSKLNLGSHAYEAQFNQSPSLPEGNIFKRQWYRFYNQPPGQLVEEMDFVCQSWDMAFKDTKDSAYVVGQVWGLKGANRYLFDRVRARLSFTETCNAVKSLTSKWPQAEAKYVEDKANGPAVIDTLRDKVGGLIPENPTESKEARAWAATPEFESGNVLLPSSNHCPWVDEFMEQLSAFPTATYKDDVDTATQALKHLKARVRMFSAVDEAAAPMVETGKKSHWSPMAITR